MGIFDFFRKKKTEPSPEENSKNNEERKEIKEIERVTSSADLNKPVTQENADSGVWFPVELYGSPVRFAYSHTRRGIKEPLEYADALLTPPAKYRKS